MNMRVRIGLAAGALGLAATVASAETGYRDDFSGPRAAWAQVVGYKATQTNGTLVLAVDKQTKWTGQYLDLKGKYDLSKSPYVNLKVMSDTPCMLHVYLVGGGKNDIRVRRVAAGNRLVDYGFDFTGAKGVDLTAVQAMIFTINGAANSWEGTLTFDDLRVGDKAVPLAGIEAIADQSVYHDSGKHSVQVTGLDHVSALKVSAGALLRNVTASAIEDGMSTIAFECAPGATGTESVSVVAVGSAGFHDNALAFGVTLEPNFPPTLDPPAAQTVQVGKACEVALSGIGDGNVAAEQPIAFAVLSSDESVLAAKDVLLSHAEGSPHARLRFEARKAGTTTLSLTLDDKGGGQSTLTRTFPVRAVSGWNTPPTVNALPDQQIFSGAGEQTIQLTGIGDGDGGKSRVTVSAVSSNAAVILNPVRVDYAGGDTAVLRLNPAAGQTGETRLIVSVKDAGGTPDNNGDQETRVTFRVTVRTEPVTGLTVKFDDWPKQSAEWRPEPEVELAPVKLGGGDALEVRMRNKMTFRGLWLTMPDMDLREYPYLTVDVKPDDALQFNAFFYDGKKHRNDGASQVKHLQAGDWQTVTFDFSGEGQMADKNGREIDRGWINQVLFNFHPKFGWPFTSYTGTLCLRNLRIGKDADVPKRTPSCAIDAAADQVYPRGAGRQEVVLHGVRAEGGAVPSVKAVSSNPSVISAPSVGAVQADGTAKLSFAVGVQTGRATVALTVSAEGCAPAQASFAADVLETSAARACAVTVNCAQKHQTIRGFGTFANDIPIDVYAGELGASAMRIGLIDNQIEPVNDNSDPAVLNRPGLDYKALDFDRLRRLHEAGVESFILTSWSPPAWMKANYSLNYQQGGAEGNCDNTQNRLDYDQYDEFAESMVAAVRMCEEEAGVTLTGIGLQNEPVFHEPYPSAILDPSHFVELIKVVGRRFAKEGITTRLFMPEQVFTQTASMNAYIDALNADPEAQRCCSVVATHGYDSKGIGEARPDFPQWAAMWARAQKGGVAKELWMTETYPAFRDWDSAFAYAMFLYGSLEYGNIGLWTSWSIEGQLIDRGRPNAAFYVCSQFWRYIRPGAVRVTTTSGDTEVAATSYVNDAKHGGKLVAVLINRGSDAKAVRVSVQGRSTNGTANAWRTDRVSRRADVGKLRLSEPVLIPPQSVTTLVED